MPAAEFQETRRGFDLEAMPAEVASLCTRAFEMARAMPTRVVHGNPGAANILIMRSGVGLVDWDESRVDARTLDLAWLPCEVSGLSEEEGRVARAVTEAREVAGTWGPDELHGPVEASALRTRKERFPATEG